MIIFKDGKNWKLGEGVSPEHAVIHYTSGENDFLPADEWRDTSDKVIGLRMIRAWYPNDMFSFTHNQVQTDEGIACKTERSTEWTILYPTDSRKCDGICICDSCGDEEGCDFHVAIKDIGYLVVRHGLKSEQNGVYELIKDSKDHPGFFKHSKSMFLIYRNNNSWALGSGTSPSDVSSLIYQNI